VGDDDRRALGIGAVAVTPADERDEHGAEVPSGLCEAVLEPGPGARLAVGNLGEDTLVDERGEALGEDVAGDAEVFLQVVEAADPVEDVPEDEDRPAVPEHLDRSRDRAVAAVEVRELHVTKHTPSELYFRTQVCQAASASRTQVSGPRGLPGAGRGADMGAATARTGPTARREIREASAGDTAIPTRAWLVLAVCAGAAFIAFLDVTIVNIAFPAIERSFSSTSLADLSWVFNGYNVVFAALLVPAGRFADLVGRRRVFIAGLVVFGFASAGCGLAPTAGVLIAFRVLQAIGAAAVAPASLALLLPVFPAARRSTAVALWGASAAVAAATGPVLGGVLVDDIGWRSVFYVNVPLVVLVVVVARRLLDESRDAEHGSVPDLLGTGLLAGGVGAIALGIVKSSQWTWADRRTLIAVAVGLGLLVAFIGRSSFVAAPALELGLFRIRSFAVANLAAVVFAAGFYALLLANVLFLTGHWGYSELAAGAAITPGPLTAALSSALTGRVIDQRGPRGVLLAGGLLFAAGAALFALRLHAGAAYLTEFLPATVLTGAGVGASFAAMSSAAVSELPAERFATGSAIVTCLRQIGAVLGLAVLIGHLAANADVSAFRSAYAVIAGAGVGTSAVALLLDRRRSVQAYGDSFIDLRASRALPESAA